MFNKIKRYFWRKRLNALIKKTASDLRKLDKYMKNVNCNRQERRQVKHAVIKNTKAVIKELERD